MSVCVLQSHSSLCALPTPVPCAIKVDADCKTEVPGVFACGDIAGKPWQVAKAVGQGCIAGIRAADFVKGD